MQKKEVSGSSDEKCREKKVFFLFKRNKIKRSKKFSSREKFFFCEKLKLENHSK